MRCRASLSARVHTMPDESSGRTYDAHQGGVRGTAADSGRIRGKGKLCCFLSEVAVWKVREDDARCDEVWLGFLARGRLWRLFCLPGSRGCPAALVLCWFGGAVIHPGLFAVGIWWVCLGSRH